MLAKMTGKNMLLLSLGLFTVFSTLITIFELAFSDTELKYVDKTEAENQFFLKRKAKNITFKFFVSMCDHYFLRDPIEIKSSFLIVMLYVNVSQIRIKRMLCSLTHIT